MAAGSPPSAASTASRFRRFPSAISAMTSGWQMIAPASRRRKGPNPLSGDGQPIRTCRPGSRRCRRSPTGYGPQVWFRATHAGERSCALSLDKSFQSFVDELGIAFEPRIALGLSKKFVIDRDRRPHRQPPDQNLIGLILLRYDSRCDCALRPRRVPQTVTGPSTGWSVQVSPGVLGGWQ
jgi:hypothetical protein